jgi:hypothetical protein
MRSKVRATAEPRCHFGMRLLLCVPSFDLRHEVLACLPDIQELADEQDMSFRGQISIIHLFQKPSDCASYHLLVFTISGVAHNGDRGIGRIVALELREDFLIVQEHRVKNHGAARRHKLLVDVIPSSPISHGKDYATRIVPIWWAHFHSCAGSLECPDPRHDLRR